MNKLCDVENCGVCKANENPVFPYSNDTHLHIDTNGKVELHDDTLKLHKFESGTKRSGEEFRYDILNFNYLARCTNNLEYGLYKYNDPPYLYNDNYQVGALKEDPKFLIDVCNHLIKHAFALRDDMKRVLSGLPIEAKEDNIAHISFNAMICSVYMDKKGYDAHYWQPIYKERIQTWLKNQEKLNALPTTPLA